MTRKLIILLFLAVFLFSLFFYVHIFTKGYNTDVSFHIALAIFYQEKVLTNLSHVGFHVALLEGTSFLAAFRIGDFLISHNLPIEAMKTLFFDYASIMAERNEINIRASSVLTLSDSMIINYHITAAILFSFFITLSTLVIYLLLRKFVAADFPHFAYAAMAVMLIVVTPVYVPFFNRHFYIGQGSPNVWHSPTYAMMKPLAYLGFLLFFEIFGKVRPLKFEVLFVLILISGIIIKPSFALVFIPSAFLFLLITDIYNIRNIFHFIALCVPVAGVLLYQSRIAYGQSSKVILDFMGVWSICSPSIPFSILRSLLFPLTVLIIFCLRRRPFNDSYPLLLAWIMAVVSLLQVMFLAESGPRYSDGNFFWGWNISLDMLFIFSVVELMRFSKEIFFAHGSMPNRHSLRDDVYRLSSEFRTHQRKDVVALSICTSAFMFHLVSGCYYILRIYSGQGYY